MATKKSTAAKPTKQAKSKTGAKSAAPVSKIVANKSTPTKQLSKKPAAPVKKAAAPAKKVAAKPAAKIVPVKNTPAKKADTNKSTAKSNKQQIVNKKNSKPVTPVKKATPAKKAAPAKKEIPVVKKKIAIKSVPAPAPKAKVAAKPAPKPAPKAKVAEKPAPKPAAKVAAKPDPKAKKEVAKPVVAPKKAEKTAPPPPPPAEPKAPSVKKLPVKKKLTVTQMPVKINPSAPKPMATPAAKSIDKKPTVIVAHRRLENKAKSSKEVENTMIQYQPETYRSILDEPAQQQGPVYRYSDEDLIEFKEIIASRLVAARKELNYLQGLITRKDEAGTDDTENRYMNMEDGSGAMEREQLAQLASRQIQFMTHLEKALVRIENKTYGICRVTGKLIDKARLRAVPHATLSIEAKKMMASKQN